MDDVSGIEAAKQASVLQLLIRCARRVDERARARVNARAGRMVARPTTMALLPHVAFEGTRVVDLAERLGISKQAVSKRVAELVGEGIVELVDDPDDRRSKRVRFTAEGRRAILAGLEVLGELERELAAALGPDRVAALGDTLRRLDHALDAAAPDPAGG